MTEIKQLIRIPDQRGNLTALEADSPELPFVPRRVYWIFDVPGGERRGGHAYRRNCELIIALSGSFDVSTDNGRQRDTFSLNRSYKAVYVPAGTWRELSNFSTNSVALIIASEDYDEADYIRDYAEFERYRHCEEPRRERTLVLATGDGRRTTVDDVRLIRLDRHHSDRKGDLCVFEGQLTVPFDIRRLFYLYDVPADADRGSHAHRTDHQLIIAAGGSFEVTLDDGRHSRTVRLSRPFDLLHVPPGIWVHLGDFSSGATALVLSNNKFNPSDYIKDYDDFKNNFKSF